MLKVTDETILKKISINDQKDLYNLMSRIYPSTCEHLWIDKGKWYIDNLYSYDNPRKELSESNSLYFFIQYQSNIVGILRILENEPLIDFKKEKAAKLQRIYLAPSAQGKGIGKALINWTENKQRELGYSILWLEVMDTQTKAIRFYEKLGFKISGKLSLESDLVYKNLTGHVSHVEMAWKR